MIRAPRSALLTFALAALPVFGDTLSKDFSGLPPLPKGAIVITDADILDGNCGASNERDEPVEIKTKSAADCDKWLAAVKKAYKHWPSETARAAHIIASQPEPSGHQLYAVAQCYKIPNLPESCTVAHETDPYGQPFDSLKACQSFILKYLAPEVPDHGKFYLGGNINWYECANRPDNRWQAP